MTVKKALMFTVAFVLVGLLVAGCGGGNSRDAQKVLDKALSNMKKWTSFKGTMKAGTTSSSSPSPASTGSAVFDVTTEGGVKMHTVTDYAGTKVEQYQIGDTTYAYMEGQGWAKQQSTSTNQLNVEIANALKKGVKDLKILSQDAGSYRLSFKMAAPDSSAQDSSSSSSTSETSETNFVVKVDKPTTNITEMKVTASSGSGSSMQNQTQVYSFSDLNSPITITLPEEAKNAKSAQEQSTPGSSGL